MDNYQFLLNFFDVFDDFSQNPFYLTGEVPPRIYFLCCVCYFPWLPSSIVMAQSYGGHYVPTLAQRVLEGKSDAGRGTKLFDRTKGFLIGGLDLVSQTSM